jgi:RecA-family ATPase
MTNLSLEPFVPPEKSENSASSIEARTPIVATPFEWVHWSQIPRRRYIYGKFLTRGFAALTVATGGVGKSMLTIVEAISIATGRPLLKEWVHEPCNTWLFNLEDPQDELTRRIMAVCKLYDVSKSDLDGRFFVNSGLDTPLTIVEQPREGIVIVRPVVDELMATIRANNIGCLVIDPFVSCHTAEENDNGAIDAIAKTWAKLAKDTNCAIHLVHHSKKTSNAVAVDDARGASALLAAVRTARTLNRMTDKEAKEADIQENRNAYVRIDDGKANLSPLSDKATWFRLESVCLENGDGGSLDLGDSVGVPTPWSWPEPHKVNDEETTKALEALRAVDGHLRENHTAREWCGHEVAKAFGLVASKGSAEKKRVQAILNDLELKRLIKRVSFKDEKGKNIPIYEVIQEASPPPENA